MAKALARIMIGKVVDRRRKSDIEREAAQKVVDARNVEKLLGSVHKYDTAGKAAIARMCLSILTKWEGESPSSSSILRLTSEAKNLLANCEVELEARRRVEREAMERIALMVELEGWVREAQDRLDAELGAIMAVGREQRSYLKKGLELDLRDRMTEIEGLFSRLSAVRDLPSASNIVSQLTSLNESFRCAIDALAVTETH